MRQNKPMNDKQSVCLAVLSLLLALPLLAGCVLPDRADDADYARTALIGLPRDDLLACAGVPSRSYKADNSEYFTYESESVQRDGDEEFFFTKPSSRDYFRPRGSFSAFSVRKETCSATFILRNGRVVALNYIDHQGNSSLAQCYPVVGNCLSYSSAIPPSARGPFVPR